MYWIICHNPCKLPFITYMFLILIYIYMYFKIYFFVPLHFFTVAFLSLLIMILPFKERIVSYLQRILHLKKSCACFIYSVWLFRGHFSFYIKWLSGLFYSIKPKPSNTRLLAFIMQSLKNLLFHIPSNSITAHAVHSEEQETLLLFVFIKVKFECTHVISKQMIHKRSNFSELFKCN